MVGKEKWSSTNISGTCGLQPLIVMNASQAMMTSLCVRVLVVTLLCSSSVVGFGFLDSLRSLQLQARQHSRRSTMPPAEALADIVKDILDQDRDGQVAITEVEGYLDMVFNPERDPDYVLPSYRVQEKGYIMTVAGIIDTNDNGVIGNEELKRASNLLVSLAGDEQVARAVEVVERMKSKVNPEYLIQQANRIVPDYTKLSDQNEDGEITPAEMEATFPFPYYTWNLNSLHLITQDVDTNDDLALNAEETPQFLLQLAVRERWLFRNFVIYFRIKELVGDDLANQWAETA
ncbi:uncharacterized protein LOC135478200 [Liolophura sinensis]|uniref:uncharacterized protein LOC135478200 n=1 Tax=Liolophura sinensis TaxID=3198878 RepID=UPI00315936C3